MFGLAPFDGSKRVAVVDGYDSPGGVNDEGFAVIGNKAAGRNGAWSVRQAARHRGVANAMPIDNGTSVGMAVRGLFPVAMIATPTQTLIKRLARSAATPVIEPHRLPQA